MLELTKEEEKILEGELGEGYRIAMKLIVGIGEAFEAKKLIEITRAHIAGISYENIGEEGLQFLKELADGGVKVKVPTTINPCGTDLEQWQEMGVREEFFLKQKEVVDTYSRLGAKTSCSCTPYVIDNLPSPGEHVAFAESSAVIYVNSFLNAYTNKESGLSALASAIIGKTPYYGLQTEEERKATCYVKTEFEVEGHLLYGVLGYLVGKYLANDVPILSHRKPSSLIEKKEFCGGLSASSGVGLVYFEEDLKREVEVKNRLILKEEDLKRLLNEFNYKVPERIDFFFSGCPHLSPDDVETIYRLLEGRELKSGSKFWLFASKSTYEKEALIINKLKKKGISIFAGACPVIAPLNYKGMKIATDSIKAAHYLRNLKGTEVYLMDIKDAIKNASR